MKTAMAIAGVDFDEVAAGDFLAWGEAGDPAEEDEAGRSASDNIFRYPAANPSVAVRVGSIHSVKGETHTATLVLETFFKSHHLKMLKKWLTGANSGGAGENATTLSRLRLHYVAMSRPSHLLCLAMREDALTRADVKKVAGCGWRVGRVSDEGTEWIDPDDG